MASYKTPPSWALKLLQRVCPPDIAEEVEGDLFEAFQWRIAEKGQSYATRKYILEVFRCLRYYRIKVQTQNPDLMLIQNYLKTGLRFLWKTRGYSSLNILGLALGIAFSWLAYVYVSEEYSYDRFNVNADNIFIGTVKLQFGDDTYASGGASYLFAAEASKQLPEVNKVARFTETTAQIKIGEQYFDQAIDYTDPEFFDIFTVRWDSQPIQDFTDPSSVVISTSLAQKLNIRKEDLYSSTVNIIIDKQERQFIVRGVFKDFPSNSSIKPSLLLPLNVWASNNRSQLNHWYGMGLNAFYLLNQKADSENVAKKMTELLSENKDLDNSVSVGLAPLLGVHLNSKAALSNGIQSQGGNKDMIIIIGIIGGLCLIISCVNYSNFSIGNNVVRLREVSVRKVFGAQKDSIFKQFIAESLLATFLALPLGLLIISLILPFFKMYTNKQYAITDFLTPQVLGAGLIIVVIVAFIAGLYPSLVLSKFKTLSGLKGKSTLNKNGWLIKGLLTVQFGISAFLILGMLTVNKQLSYMLKFDIGYPTEKLVKVTKSISNKDSINNFKTSLLSTPGVESASLILGANSYNIEKDNGDKLLISYISADTDYLKTMGVELILGDDFNSQNGSDGAPKVIVNEAFLREYPLPNPIGTQINFQLNNTNFRNPVIVGVIKDFNFRSLHSEISPLLILDSKDHLVTDVYVRISRNEVSQSLINAYSNTFGDNDLNYQFVEDDLAKQYEKEALMKEISMIGSAVAIFLSCIGLLGVVGSQVRQKLKDVSIRKAIGAQPYQIILLFSKSYFLLIIIGFCLGFPIAYKLLHDWLTNYVNRISFSWDLGLITLSIIILVSALTILSQLLKAIRVNPVKYLKEE